jgi:hypothetical protein
VVTGLGKNNAENNQIEFKFDFFKNIFEYEFLVPLSLPTPNTFQSISDLQQNFSQKHFLPGLLLEHLSFHIGSKEKPVREIVIHTFHYILMSHEIDSRYQSPDLQQRIAGMYFPFLLIVIDNISKLKEGDFDEKRELFGCFLYILKNADKELLDQWWRKETQTRIILFLEALLECVDVFEYVGLERWNGKMGESKVFRSHIATKAAIENYYTESGPKITKIDGYRSLREKRAEASKSVERRKALFDASHSSEAKKSGTIKSPKFAESTYDDVQVTNSYYGVVLF